MTQKQKLILLYSSACFSVLHNMMLILDIAIIKRYQSGTEML